MLNVDQFPIAISQDQKIKEEINKHLNAELKEDDGSILDNDGDDDVSDFDDDIDLIDEPEFTDDYE